MVKWIMPPTHATRIALGLMAFIVAASATYLVLQYPTLPWLLPVHFKADGVPNGWQYRTPVRVLMPVFVQLALAATSGAIGALLLSLPRGSRDVEARAARAAAAAAEAVALIALIWVAFQGYVAWALARMWTTERGGLGLFYTYLELSCLVLTAIVAVRAQGRVGRPVQQPHVAEHWRFGQLYSNRDNPALFVPTRDGSRWTLNFGRPIAVALLGLILVIGIIGPTIILGLALRS